MSSADKPSDGTVTRLLRDARMGDDAARNRLFELTFEPLKQIARNHIARAGLRGRRDTTSLVQDAVLKLLRQHRLDAQNRPHFFFVMKRAMADELFRGVRNRGAAPSFPTLEIPVGEAVTKISGEELREALEHLETANPDAANVFVLKTVYGCTLAAVAELTGTSHSAAQADWRYSLAWLRRYLSERGRRRR